MEAAARTAARNGDEPGEVSMTRHGIIQRSAAGARPSATGPRVSMVVADADRRASGLAPGRQHRTEVQRNCLSALMPASTGYGRAIADTGRNPKSP
jgi:hypothetical protein